MTSAPFVQGYKDLYGNLHEKEADAIVANKAYAMRRAIHKLLGGNSIIRFGGTDHCAEWIYDHIEELIEIYKTHA